MKTRLNNIRVGIVSDTHGFLDERIAAAIRDCDIAIHAGDIMGYHVLQQLQPRQQRVIAVRGNNDVPENWSPDDHQALLALPFETSVELPGGELAVTHGHKQYASGRWHQRLRKHFTGCRTVVYGHSHYLEIDQQEEPWVLNPGAAGRIRTHGGPSCLVLEASQKHWHVEHLRFPSPGKQPALN
jgi:putative phosphoesterase